MTTAEIILEQHPGLRDQFVPTRDGNMLRTLVYQFMVGWESVYDRPEMLLSTLHPDGFVLELPEGRFDTEAALRGYIDQAIQSVARGAHHVLEVEVAPQQAGESIAHILFVGQVGMRNGDLSVLPRRATFRARPGPDGFLRVVHYSLQDV